MIENMYDFRTRERIDACPRCGLRAGRRLRLKVRFLLVSYPIVFAAGVLIGLLLRFAGIG
jgi:hypothetical protein